MGVTEAVSIRKRVEDKGGVVINHCYKTPVSIAACLHWLVTAPSAVIFEDCVEESVRMQSLQPGQKHIERPATSAVHFDHPTMPPFCSFPPSLVV